MQLGIKQLFRYTKNVSCGEKEERKKQKEKKESRIVAYYKACLVVR